MINAFRKYACLLLIMCNCFASCLTQTTKEINEVNDVIYKLIDADNRSDISGVLIAYTDSVEFYPAGKSFTKGIENVRSNYEKLFRENKLSIKTEISETKVFGNDAIVKGINHGTKTSLIDSSTTNLNDKYIAILIRIGDTWKIDKLIWSPNQ